MRKFAFCLATFASAATLAACGGATVDSDDVTESGATSTTAAASTGATDATATATTSASTATVTERSTSIREGSYEDQPAREVDAPATMVPTYSPQEQAYLDHLKESGVNVDGIEDQLTATGATVCANDPITRDAVAGQLVEQRRTDMDASAVAALLSDTARANLCS
ncbi:hypothetical protein [Corynebacterium jeddahense]|uniref:DUF732 domain-containing protein n=1 Tax=Corynebacterium jeddahense TaxID=1414719 RepID=A0ABY7UNQ2_9CORY|nr:hypothetical protein [Corynebacterium jeddahense]WCZ39796.1 hypothetical protein CJEDD_11135 [Corynebacterium jeddahense]